MKPLFRIAWHFWTNTKYSGEVSLIISVDIHPKHWEFTQCPSSTVASTFNSRQYLRSLKIPKQISYVLRGIKQAISRNLVNNFWLPALATAGGAKNWSSLPRTIDQPGQDHNHRACILVQGLPWVAMSLIEYSPPKLPEATKTCTINNMTNIAMLSQKSVWAYQT